MALFLIREQPLLYQFSRNRLLDELAQLKPVEECIAFELIR